MKVELHQEKLSDWHAFGHITKTVSKALPFYKSRKGVYVHRVRSMNQYWRHGKYHHASIGFWCGNTGHLGEKGVLLAKVPDGEVVCATCEGRAIGAGQDGARVINGQAVMFSPRKKDRIIT